MRRLLLATTMLLLVTGRPASAGLITDLGYNLFTTGSVNQANSDYEGRAAIGGNGTFSSFSINSSHVSGAALVVGGNLSISNSQINGDTYVGGTASLSNTGLNGGTLFNPNNPLNFANLGSQLSSDSQLLASLTATGTAFYDNGLGREVLKSTNASLAVFNITTTDLQKANNQGLDFQVNPNATVLVNVSGTSASLANFQTFLNGSSANKILYNFTNATSLSSSSASIEGTVIAPLAAVNLSNMHINGSLYTSSLTGNGELHNVPFTGTIPVVPEPTSMALSLIGLGTIGVVLYRKNRHAASQAA